MVNHVKLGQDSKNGSTIDLVVMESASASDTEDREFVVAPTSTDVQPFPFPRVAEEVLTDLNPPAAEVSVVPDHGPVADGHFFRHVDHDVGAPGDIGALGQFAGLDLRALRRVRGLVLQNVKRVTHRLPLTPP